MINFVRLVPVLEALGSTVLIDAHESLVRLLEESGFANVGGFRSKEEYDYHCSVMSIPHLLGLSKQQLSVTEPYIKTQERTVVCDEGFKVGIAWAGGPRHLYDETRSCHLKHFKKIEQIPGVKLISLQKDLRPRKYPHNPQPVNLTESCDEMNIVDTSQKLKDFSATAAIINELDLVISVDTVILHLAAAMGKETWGLIAYNPDWRWELEGEETRWYPTAKLYRQPDHGNWDAVFEKVSNDLKERLA